MNFDDLFNCGVYFKICKNCGLEFYTNVYRQTLCDDCMWVNCITLPKTSTPPRYRKKCKKCQTVFRTRDRKKEFCPKCSNLLKKPIEKTKPKRRGRKELIYGHEVIFKRRSTAASSQLKITKNLKWLLMLMRMLEYGCSKSKEFSPEVRVEEIKNFDCDEFCKKFKYREETFKKCQANLEMAFTFYAEQENRGRSFCYGAEDLNWSQFKRPEHRKIVNVLGMLEKLRILCYMGDYSDRIKVSDCLGGERTFFRYLNIIDYYLSKYTHYVLVSNVCGQYFRIPKEELKSLERGTLRQDWLFFDD